MPGGRAFHHDVLITDIEVIFYVRLIDEFAVKKSQRQSVFNGCIQRLVLATALNASPQKGSTTFIRKAIQPIQIPMDPVYFQTQAEIQRELGSGEKLLWSGQPRQGLRLNITDAFILPFSLIWCGFAIFWEASVLHGHAPLLMKLWGVPFVVIGLYLVVGRFFVDAYTRGRTFYGVTNQRLVIVSGSFSRRVRSLPWQALPQATLVERGNGGGTINFGPKLPFGMGRSVSIGGMPGAGQSLFPVLDLPEHAREAYDAVRLAQQSAQREEPMAGGDQTSPRFTTPAKSLPPPPRRVYGRLGGSLWFTRIFIMPHMLAGIGGVGYLFFLLLWGLLGADYPGTVVSSKVWHSAKHGDTYTLNYRFEADGETRLDSAKVSWSVYQTYLNPAFGQTNPPVTVHYLGVGPLHHAALRETGSPWSEIGFLTLWAVFWNGVLSFFVYAIWVKPIRARLLYKNGEATAGKLLRKRMSTGKSSTYYVGYRFKDPYSGQDYESEIQVWKADDWAQAVEGQPVTVLFAKGNPKRSTVYEFGGYRVEGG